MLVQLIARIFNVEFRGLGFGVSCIACLLLDQKCITNPVGCVHAIWFAQFGIIRDGALQRISSVFCIFMLYLLDIVFCHLVINKIFS